MKKNKPNSKFFSIPLASFLLLFVLVGFLPGGKDGLAINAEDNPRTKIVTTQIGDTPVPEVNSYGTSANITLKEFNQETLTIAYPGVGEFYFDLPNRWEIKGKGISYFELHYDLDDPKVETFYGYANRTTLPRMQVYINDIFIGSFIPETGRNLVKQIPLYTSFFDYSFRSNPFNEYNVRIEYQANLDDYCEYYGVLTVYDHSFFHFEFSVLPAPLDLAGYSNSVSQDSFIPETLYIVLPNDFNESDLNTAALLLQDISDKTFENVNIKLITPSEITWDLLAKSSMVTIGMPSRNSFTADLFEKELLKPSLSNTKSIEYSVPIEDGDSFLQVIPNYLNNIYGIMVISGNSDEAVHRGVKALINPAPDLSGEFFIVKKDAVIQEVEQVPLSFEDMTFKSLGFREKAYYGMSTRYAYISFYLPRNWEVQEGAALSLVYNHSGNLSKTHTSFTVILNGRLIGTAPINPQISGDKDILIPLQPENLIPGSLNVIVFEMNLVSPIECAPLNMRAFWSTIRDRSSIHIPYKEIGLDGEFPPFVHPLYYLAYDDSNLIISLPPEPSTNDLNAMAKLVQLISNMSPQSLIFSVSLDPDIDLSSLVDENMIVIGKPTENLVLGKLNEVLPQPFVSGDDTLLEKVGNISYRVPADVDIGMVEVLPSTWNPTKGITVVTGTTDIGYMWGVDLLASDDYLYDFFGDVFFIYEKKITSFQSMIPMRDTLDEIVGDVSEQEVTLELISPTEDSTTTESSSPDSYNIPIGQQDGAEQQAWGFGQYFLAGILVIGISIAILTLARTARGGRSD